MASTPFYSWDITADTNVRDVSDYLAAVLYAEQRFIGRVQIGEAVTDMKYEWMEETGNDLFITQSGSGDLSGATSQTTLDIASTPKTLHIDCVLKEPASAETVRVSSLTSGIEIEVERGYNGIKTTHASGAKWEILFWARGEGSTKEGNKIKSTHPLHNVTSTFRWDMSATRNQVKRNMHAMSDFWAHNIELRTKEFKFQLPKALLYSTFNPSLVSGATHDGMTDGSEVQTMKGLRDFIVNPVYGTAIKNTVAQPISLKLVNTLVRQITEKGADGDGGRFVALMSPSQAERCSYIAADKLRYDPNVTKRGNYVSTLMTALGVDVDIVYDAAVQDTDLYILTMSKISLHPFTGAAWFTKHYDSDFDGVEVGILGEWTCKVTNADQEFAIATALTL